MKAFGVYKYGASTRQVIIFTLKMVSIERLSKGETVLVTGVTGFLGA